MMGFPKKEKFDGLYNDGISFFGKFDGLINDKISKKGNVDRLHNPLKFPKKAIFLD